MPYFEIVLRNLQLLTVLRTNKSTFGESNAMTVHLHTITNERNLCFHVFYVDILVTDKTTIVLNLKHRQ